MTDGKTVLRVEKLTVHFPLPNGDVVHAVDGISFNLAAGQALGLVGESGSGKTTAALACARLNNISSGRIWVNGREITNLNGSELKNARRDFQVVFQDPFASLNPRERAVSIVRRPLELLGIGTKAERENRVDELFSLVGLRADQKELFPHQFSGGQRQRIGIARALGSSPKLIVCDEPVSALDVAIQAQILNLLSRLKQQLLVSYLFISHDLAVIQHLCDQIAVMYLGQIVEMGSRASLFNRPMHPYTHALISAVPKTEIFKKDNRSSTRLPGDPPSPISPPVGCRFAARCVYAQNRCWTKMPELRDQGGDHLVSCHRLDDPELRDASQALLS